MGTSARATCSPVCSPGCWGHPGVPLAAGCGQSPGEQDEAAHQPVLSNTLAKVKVPCVPPGEPRGVPGHREQPPHCRCPWGWWDRCGVWVGAPWGGRHRRGQGPDPHRGSLSCQHPCASTRRALGCCRSTNGGTGGVWGWGCTRHVPLLLLPAGAAAPASDVPGQGSLCPMAVREPALAVCRGGDGLAAAAVGSSPSSSSG